MVLPKDFFNFDLQFISLFSDSIVEVANKRDERIVQLRFGLFDGRPQSLQEIGEQFGLSRERIRQIVKKVIGKIKSKAKFQETSQIYTGISYLFKKFIEEEMLTENELDLQKILSFMRNSSLPTYQTLQLILDFIFTAHKKSIYSKIASLYSTYLDAEQKISSFISGSKRVDESIIPQIIWPNGRNRFNYETVTKFEPIRTVNYDNGYNTGQFHSEKLGKNIMYESGLELNFIQRLEKAEQVQYYVEQPFQIKVKLKDGSLFNYTPDFFLLLNDNTGVIVEIKPIPAMGLYSNISKWISLHEYCRDRNLGYMITNGYSSIQKICSNEANGTFEDKTLSFINAGTLNWKTFSKIKEEYGIHTKSFIPFIIRNNLNWRLTPFSIKKAEESFPVEWKNSRPLCETNNPKSINPQNNSIRRVGNIQVSENLNISPQSFKGQLWTDNEEKKLIQAFMDGKPISQIAKIHGRTSGAITARLKKVGLIKK